MDSRRKTRRDMEEKNKTNEKYKQQVQIIGEYLPTLV